jgi:hypothetical protein
MTLTGQGLVLGAGTMVAKLDDKAVPIEADQERIWTLLSVAFGDEIFAGGIRIASPRGKTRKAARVEPGALTDDDHGASISAK